MSADRLPERVNPYAAPALPASHPEPVAPKLPASLRKVARGLRIYRAAEIVYLLASIGVTLGSLVIRFAHRGAANMHTVNAMGSAVSQLSSALGLLAAIFCLAVPPGSKALHLIQASLVFGLLMWLVRGASYIGGSFYLTYYYSEFLPSLAAGIFFLLFLRRISASMQRLDLEQRSLKFMRLYLPWWAILAVLVGPLPKDLDIRAQVPNAILIGVTYMAYLGWLWLTVRYVNLLRDIRLAILGEDGAKLIADATPNAADEITPVSRD